MLIFFIRVVVIHRNRSALWRAFFCVAAIPHKTPRKVWVLPAR